MRASFQQLIAFAAAWMRATSRPPLSTRRILGCAGEAGSPIFCLFTRSFRAGSRVRFTMTIRAASNRRFLLKSTTHSFSAATSLVCLELPSIAVIADFERVSRISRLDFPAYSCVDALSLFVGSVDVVITWTRIAWDAAVADQWRYGAPTTVLALLQFVVCCSAGNAG